MAEEYAVRACPVARRKGAVSSRPTAAYLSLKFDGHFDRAPEAGDFQKLLEDADATAKGSGAPTRSELRKKENSHPDDQV